MKISGFVKLKESFAKKTIRQKIRICIGLSLLVTFIFFVIKGNFFDTRTSPQPSELSQVADTTDSGEESSPPQEESNAQSSGNVSFHINWLDIGILAALLTAYGAHKYREKKREKRL